MSDAVTILTPIQKIVVEIIFGFLNILYIPVDSSFPGFLKSFCDWATVYPMTPITDMIIP